MTHSLSAASWLTSLRPPLSPEHNGLGWPPAEVNLWWAVVVFAARDVLRGTETEAWDGADFLKDTGAQLVSELFGISVEETRKELAHLIKRSRALGGLARGYKI